MSGHPPTPEQQAVIEDRSDDVLVVAGAGTGKTTTMVARYVHLLEQLSYEPREILAFTFTDKAAGELRERVRTALQSRADERGEPNPQAVSMSDAWIGTFHAICLRILKAWPIEAKVDPGFTVIDDVTAETLRGAAFAAALENLRAEVPEPETPERLSVEEMVGIFRESELRKTVIFAYDELRSRGMIEPRLPDFERRSEYPADQVRDLARLGPMLRAERPNGWGSKQERVISFLEELHDSDARPGFDTIATLDFERKNAEGPSARLMEMLPLVQEAVACHEFGDDCRSMVSRLLELFGVEFEKLKRQRSVLDYEDLQLLTVALLRDRPRVRRAYAGRFREVMVDEFQDTNQLQLDLVELLRNDPEEPGCDPDRPRTTLVTVGDEMQSIYSFRHADVEIFRSRARREGVSVRRLTGNFRSQPTVIDAVNTIGSSLRRQIRRDETFPELEPGLPPEGEQSARLILTALDGWKEQNLGELAPVVPPEIGKERMHQHEAEALRLARHIRHLVRDEGIRQNEIAVLFRATTRVPLYAKALRQFGLTPYIARSSGFWETREALDMRALLGVIANPLDDESLVTVLASPACAISSDAMWLLARARPFGQPLWRSLEWALGGEPLADDEEKVAAVGLVGREDLGRLERFRDEIGKLRRSAFSLPLDELVFRAAESTGYDLAGLADDPSGNSWAGVRRFATLAREYEESEGRDLRGFLDWAALSAELDNEAGTATADENSDVIRLMTVHAAKGLEFEVVCVPDCGRGIGSQDKLPIRIGRPREGESDFPVAMRIKSREGNRAYVYGWQDLGDVASASDEAEELRLFHVALTRAKRHLVISGVMPSKFDSPAPGRSTITRTCNGIDPEKLHPDQLLEQEGPATFKLQAGGDLVVEANNPGEDQAALLRESEDSSQRDRLEISAAPPLERPPARRFPNVPLSFTAMNEFAECPTAFYAKRILGLPEPEAPASVPADPETTTLMAREDATRFGTVVHDLLEATGKRGWRPPEETMVAEALEKRQVMSDRNLTRAQAMITGFLDSELGQEIRTARCAFEVPLLLRLDQVTIRGFADLIAGEAPPLVVDYKTNRLEEKTPGEKMGDFIDQRDLYALALADAKGLDEVDTAYVFLERPDEPVTATLTREDLELARERLGETLAEITAGSFFGGTGARQPCGDCWACLELEARRAA